MNNKIYNEGENICKNLFWKTGDLRFYNMANGFKEMNK